MSYGASTWGLAPWGSSSLTGVLALVRAVPVAENRVRLEFDQAVRLTGLFDPSDAANPARYVVTPVDGTIASDGTAPRAVRVITAELAPVVGGAGRYVDVTLDRPMSREPARYAIAVNQIRALVSGDALALTDGARRAEFVGLGRELDVNAKSAGVARTDFANPQTTARAGVKGGAVMPGQKLGTYVVDERGDYAIDTPLESYRKRVFRRLTSKRRGFYHLPGYGLGFGDRVKKLIRAGSLETAKNEAVEQIKREPDTATASVAFVQTDANPEVVRIVVRATMRSGETLNDAIDFSTGD